MISLTIVLVVTSGLFGVLIGMFVTMAYLLGRQDIRQIDRWIAYRDKGGHLPYTDWAREGEGGMREWR